jgi:hypothetical protein
MTYVNMSISPRTAPLPASEGIFSCNLPPATVYCTSHPCLVGIVAIAPTRICTGNRLFSALLANLTANVKNGRGDEVEISVIFRYVSSQPAQFDVAGRHIRGLIRMSHTAILGPVLVCEGNE